MESKELQKLKTVFEKQTKIKILGTIEEQTFPHWKRLVLPQLNSAELIKVAYFIMLNFNEPDKFTHLLPKIQTYENRLVLTVDVELIKKYLKDE